MKAEPSSPPDSGEPKRRGRPPGKTPRKEQLRMATFRHRMKSKRELLQVELNTGIAYFIRRELEAGHGASKREIVERLLLAGIRTEIPTGKTYLGNASEGFAEGLIAEWLK